MQLLQKGSAALNSNIIYRALTAIRGFILHNETDVLLVACIVAIAGFLFACIALNRCRKLKTEVKDLRRSTQRLISAEEKRLLKDMAALANSKTPTDGSC